MEATSRLSASRSTRSAWPQLRMTLTTGLPVRGCRSLCANCKYDTTVPSLFCRQNSLKYTPASQIIQAKALIDRSSGAELLVLGDAYPEGRSASQLPTPMGPMARS